MKNGYGYQDFEELEGKINSLLLNKKNHIEISSKEVFELDEILNKFIENDYESNKRRINVLKHNIEALRPYALKSENKDITKWDIFVDDINRLEGEKFNSLKELVNLMNKKSDDIISEEEFKMINDKYSEVLPLIHNDFLDFQKNRIINELNKRIKLFKNRLSRFGGNDFGAWIRALRKSKKYSLKKLESLSGITASYIHRLETGSRNTPSVSVAESLAKALGVTSEELFKKLNINTTVSQKSQQEKLTLQQLIAFNDFYLDGVKATSPQKNEIINVITQILSSDWGDNNKVQNAIEITNKIENLKKVIPPVKEIYVEEEVAITDK